MKYYAVLDTNVLVSSLLKRNSVPGQILSETLIGCITPLYNADILSEYGEVLSRPKFNFSEDIIESLLSQIINRGVKIDAEKTDEYFPDPDDVVFYEVVLSARDKENAYLVTGNIKHFPVKPFIVTPREMLDIIQKNEP